MVVLVRDAISQQGPAAWAALAVVASGAFRGESAGASFDDAKRDLRATFSKDPLECALLTIFGSAFLFYLAEKSENPKVNTYWDALLFVSTCMSVGYADVFALTPVGKAIASTVMTFGPAMTAAILNPPSTEEQPAPVDPRLLEAQQLIAQKLDAILAELSRRGE